MEDRTRMEEPTAVSGPEEKQSASEVPEFREGAYCARLISTADTLAFQACLQLRYGYFVQQRRWVGPRAECPGQEWDRYDPHALHLAVYDSDNLIAYLRVLPYREEVGFMLDDEFQCLIASQPASLLERPRTEDVELSRLVCQHQPLRSHSGKDQFHPVELLLKLLYHVALNRGFEQFYIVVEENWLRPFARRFGLRFRVLDEPYTFPDGTRTVAASATLRELEAAMECFCRDKHAWYQQSEA